MNTPTTLFYKGRPYQYTQTISNGSRVFSLYENGVLVHAGISETDLDKAWSLVSKDLLFDENLKVLAGKYTISNGIAA